jgi:hypothetical protein
MGNLIQSGISFTVNNTEAVGGFATKRTNSGLLTSGKYDITKKQTLINGNYESTSNGFSINAVDIDWNIAELPNSDTTTGGLKTIKNSGELLKLIDDMQKEIYVLTAAVISLANR